MGRIRPDGTGSWRNEGSISFIPQTPPACDITTVNCNIIYSLGETPVFSLYTDATLTPSLGDPCSKSSSPLGYFDPKPNIQNNVNNITANDLFICFNEQTQKWQVKLNPSYTLYMNYIIGLCIQQFPKARIIKNISEVCKLSSTDKRNALISLKKHMKYPMPLTNSFNEFIFEEILPIS